MWPTSDPPSSLHAAGGRARATEALASICLQRCHSHIGLPGQKRASRHRSAGYGSPRVSSYDLGRTEV
jgi:hypothetical protein